MATHTDKLLIISNGIPSKIAPEDTIELSSGNLVVGGDLTVNGEVNLSSEQGVNISSETINISNGASSIDINEGSNTIDVDTAGNFGVVAGSANFMSQDNNNSAFLVEDNSGIDYFKIVTTDSSEEIVMGNITTTPDFNFIGGGKIIITIFQASENITAGQALCLTSENSVGISSAADISKAHIIGIAAESASENNLVKIIAIPGNKVTIVNNLGNPTTAAQVYLSETSGEFTTSPPSASGSTVFKAGYALNSNTILFQPQFIKINP